MSQYEFISKLLENSKPYSTIGSPDDVYMDRAWLKEYGPGAPLSVRLHNIRRSDTDRALHDHPWENISIILEGEMIEVTPLEQGQPCMMDTTKYSQFRRRPGDVIARRATDRHRLIIPEGQSVWTIFIMGVYEQPWGFYDPVLGVKVPWREYLNYGPDEGPATVTDGREIGT